ncbi:MAG: type II toxin-antitoxin system PemK/MazF family toxin [Bifidobacteriaceae bacterium]|nr:type II toxin-antitoxin system PemK/MazF family toxin [Bifidobacteriaceae bacterium]
MSEPINAGDIYQATPASGKGREQHGQRPVLVVTDSRLTAMGLCWVVPLSTTVRDWPTHHRLVINDRATYAMCEQLRAISTERLGRKSAAIDHAQLAEVKQVLRSILGR